MIVYGQHIGMKFICSKLIGKLNCSASSFSRLIYLLVRIHIMHAYHCRWSTKLLEDRTYSSVEATELYNYRVRSNIYIPDIPTSPISVKCCSLLILLMKIPVLPNLPRNGSACSFSASSYPPRMKYSCRSNPNPHVAWNHPFS
jgi:hypothetical protein